MGTIATISQKGGAGETTLAVHLAVAADSAGKQAVIVDLHPQASTIGWKDLRNGTDTPVSSQSARLQQVLRAASDHGASLAMISTAPDSDRAALAAAQPAGLVLMPCRPAILDLRAISANVDLAKLAEKKAFVVLNAVPPRGSLASEAVAAIEHYGIGVVPVNVGHRATYVHSLTVGKTAQEHEPHAGTAQEITEVDKCTCRQARM